MSLPLPTTQKKEEDLRFRLSQSKKMVTDIQIYTSTSNYDAQELVHLLQAELPKLRVHTAALLAYLDNKAPPGDATAQQLRGRVRRMYSRCILLQTHAKSLVDAKETDEKIAEFQFETFTPPYGIADWTDWTSHERKTCQKQLIHVEEAVDWWEELYSRAETIKTALEKGMVDLRRDFDLVCKINQDQRLIQSSRLQRDDAMRQIEAWCTQVLGIPLRELQG